MEIESEGPARRGNWESKWINTGERGGVKEAQQQSEFLQFVRFFILLSRQQALLLLPRWFSSHFTWDVIDGQAGKKKQLSKSVVFDPELRDKVICCVAGMKVTQSDVFHLVIMVVMGCCRSHSFFKKNSKCLKHYTRILFAWFKFFLFFFFFFCNVSDTPWLSVLLHN